MNPKRIIQQVAPMHGDVGELDGHQVEYGACAQSGESLRPEQFQNLQDAHAGKYVPPWKSIPFAGNINGSNMVLQVLVMPGDTLGEVKARMDQEMPVLRNYEVWCWPENKLLMYSVDVFRIVFEEGQHLILRRNLGFFELFGRLCKASKETDVIRLK
jgi:hypothetical protein